MTHAHDSTLLARLGFADPDRRNPLHDAACQYLAQESKAQKLADMLLKEKRPPSQENFESNDGSAVDFIGTWSFDSRRAELEKPIGKGTGQYRSIVGFLDVSLTVMLRRRDVGRRRPRDRIVRPSGWGPATAADIEEEIRHRSFRGLLVPKQTGAIHVHASSITGDVVQTETYERKPLGPIALSELHCYHELPKLERCEWEPYESSKTTELSTIHIEVKAHAATAGDVLRQIALYREFAEPGTWLLATCYPITRRDADALKNASIAHVQLDPATVQAWAEQHDAGTYEAPSI